MKETKFVIDANTQKNIDSWLQGNYDEASKTEIRRLQQENPEELLNAFYQPLNFGTGGLRGIMGVGTNRINPYTVRATTQGLANYILKQPGSHHKVLIGYDCRHHSQELALEAAKVLAANQIEVFFFKELRPVALISYGVLYHKCIAGIMITASHNPPAYNGYKVYWSYGGQVLPPHDQGIIEEVNKITDNSLVKIANAQNPLIHTLSDEVDQSYIKTLRSLQLHDGDNHSHGKDLNIIYTSLHGGGITMVPPVLKDWSFTNLHIVEEQKIPDGSFPTIQSPNPEDHAAMALGIKKLQQQKGDLLIGTDPDSDRLGLVVLHNNKPFFFDGNQTACLLLEHICRSLKQTHTMPPKPMFIKTIVTTELFRKIAEHHQGGCLDVLTGFKYVGEKIHQWEEEKKADTSHHHFIFGAEESYGYLHGTHVRDKDAMISAASLCEAALQMKQQGKTLVDLLYEIYQTYGIYREKLLSLTLEGKEGADKIKQMMERLRHTPPTQIADLPVTCIEDYLLRKSSPSNEPILLPKSNVLRFWLSDGTKLVIRPSGTEPKIKIYCGVQDKHHHKDRHSLEKAIAVCDTKLDEILALTKKMLLA